MKTILRYAEQYGEMYKQSKTAKRTFSVFVTCLLFLAVYFVGTVASAIPVTVVQTIVMFSSGDFMGNYITAIFAGSEGQLAESLSEMTDFILTNPTIIVATLFSEIFIIGAVLIFCGCIEKRPLRSLGFSLKGLKNYPLGLLAGAVAFGGAVGISLLSGAGTVTLNPDISVGFIVLFFFGWLVQGACEEIMIRGYLMMSTANKSSLAFGLFSSSIVFAIMHLGNRGLDEPITLVIALLNLLLFGFVLGLYILRYDDIWGACAFHAAWNFVQGNVFGVKVSGQGGMPSVFVFETGGKTLINGGAFGIEGGLGATFVLLLFLGYLLFVSTRKIEDKIIIEEKEENTESSDF